MKKEEIKKIVKDRYGKIAEQGDSCCSGPKSPCCGSASRTEDISKLIGYTDEELKAVPEGANLGLGCGNPVALASLKEGETVLDLGSGAGFDCFLAADRVGKKGRVIGVDMTPEMIKQAKRNAKKGNCTNVEFRLGEIESLPVDDNSVDVIISNCVINLSPDKDKVFKEALRVLKPGGRLMVSDIVLLKELPAVVRQSVEAYIGCLAGAVKKDQYIGSIKAAGFGEVEIIEATSYPVEYMVNDPVAKELMKGLKIPQKTLGEMVSSVSSMKIRAIKSSQKSGFSSQ